MTNTHPKKVTWSTWVLRSLFKTSDPPFYNKLLSTAANKPVYTKNTRFLCPHPSTRKHAHIHYTHKLPHPHTSIYAQRNTINGPEKRITEVKKHVEHDETVRKGIVVQSWVSLVTSSNQTSCHYLSRSSGHHCITILDSDNIDLEKFWEKIRPILRAIWHQKINSGTERPKWAHTAETKNK